MARVKNTLWQRYKYKLNGLVLLLSIYFLYQSLTPVFPDTWAPKQIGSFEITPMPFNLDAPYLHHDVYTKDFFFIINKGDVKTIRQGYVNIGPTALSLEKLAMGDDGILHGSQHGQEAHAISPQVLQASDRLWLTIENWQGEQLITSWDLPKELLL
ncbi:hypothetical protein [Colwellia echini]|uniref:Uncharacterized protein n=1 Tax=Colwellia echini TaxID=1982103 RepID=A0ABY3MTX5_9GAMM|nr:hypothetical protein [Colwellia echini]TYK64663.1 hypothetical protein CWS31_014515 [Colwellia echini]